jgi:D-alanyl-D-alanine carboxypeptidase
MKKIHITALLFCLAPFACKAQAVADSMLNFIRANQKRAAVYVVLNDTVIAKQNENTMMPLASTVKIMVAIEFAKQAAANVFDENNYVSLAELEKYYIPNTDGDAHPRWLGYERKLSHIKNDSIKLMDVARGMMIFSSNANTEFLMDLLGLDNVKNNIQLLDIKAHSAIYPLVASLFMYQNPNKKTEASILKSIKKLSDEQYSRYIYDMHKALKYDTVLKSKFNPADLTPKMQQLWSDRLPSSNVKAYAHICNVLNNRRYFNEDTYLILAEVMEFIMENPANRQWLKHAGGKGGSTASVFTKASYASTKKEQRFEIIYFFNNLTDAENTQLQKWSNTFELAILSNPAFREKLKSTLR